MRFQVPQFIDMEDKVFGPFTFKQFVYLAGGAGICYMFYRLLPFIFALLVILPIAGLSLSLAFVKINNKNFASILEAFIKYVIGGRLYIWKKAPKKTEIKKEIEPEADKKSLAPKLSGSKLKDIAWSLDVLDINKNEER